VLAFESGACQRLHQEEGVNVRRLLTASFCLAAALVFATPARAADFTWGFTGSLGANVVFHDLGGGLLQITLTNTGTGDVDAPSQVLTAINFNCSCGTLTPVSANVSGDVVNSGSVVVAYNPGSPLNVGGEWAYLTAAQSGTGSQAITSMGGYATGTPNFNGPNLGGPDNSVDGVQYGIVPSTEDGIGNGGVTGNDLIQHDVVFVLSGFNGDLSHITNVSFEYGTAVGENPFGGGSGSGSGSGGGAGQTLVPEPTSLLLFGSGLAMTAYRARRKKQQKNS
jgi:hypothetical protein